MVRPIGGWENTTKIHCCPSYVSLPMPMGCLSVTPIPGSSKMSLAVGYSTGSWVWSATLCSCAMKVCSWSCWWSVSGCSWLQARRGSSSSRMRRFMFFSFLSKIDGWLSPNLPQCINDYWFYLASYVPLPIARQDLAPSCVVVPIHKLPCITTTPRIASNSLPNVSRRFVLLYLTSERQCSFFVQHGDWQFSQHCLCLNNF